MRFAAGLIIAFVCSGALASQPGQPLDCSDMVLSVPGLSCRMFVAFPGNGSQFMGRGQNMTLDNTGYLYIGELVHSESGPERIEIRRSNDGGQTVEVVAQIVGRLVPPTNADQIRFIDSSSSGYTNASNQLNDRRVLFDPIHGRLLAWLFSYCTGSACPCGGSGCSGTEYGGVWIAAIEGLPTLYEVQQSYIPGATLGFTVPWMPEGLGGADHFDTYWGPLSKPLDFTQAHPLACDYPATAPQVGDYLTVADTVPTPPPGQGVYYVTSTTYQGATRYGRKTSVGHLSGRGPALLPACTP